MIHIGRFQGRRPSVSVETCDLDGRLETEVFPLPDYGAETPEFISRFGPAYKRELAYFVRQCMTDESFCVTHRDGLVAMQVAATATGCVQTNASALPICYKDMAEL